MREEIEKTITEKMDEMNPNLNEIYSNNGIKITEMVDNQNKNIEEERKRKILLSILKEANDNGNHIDYNEQMSIEELESLAKNIEV